MKVTAQRATAEILAFKGKREDREAIKRTRGFRDAERELSLVAVNLIGTPRPVQLHTRNTTAWPVLISIGDPGRVAQRTASAHWDGSKDEPFIMHLMHTWTRSEHHAQRLKAALYPRLVGDDPGLSVLNGSWVDRPDWREAFDGLVAEAVADIRAGGEEFAVYDDEQWFRMIDALRRRRAAVGL